MATTLIEVCTRKGDTGRALATYQLMKEAGPSSSMVPSVHAYTAAMRAAAEGGAWDKALDIWSDMEQRGCKPTGNVQLYCHFARTSCVFVRCLMALLVPLFRVCEVLETMPYHLVCLM